MISRWGTLSLGGGSLQPSWPGAGDDQLSYRPTRCTVREPVAETPYPLADPEIHSRAAGDLPEPKLRFTSIRPSLGWSTVMIDACPKAYESTAARSVAR